MEENKTEAVGRYKIYGSQHMLAIPKQVRAAMGLIKGDYIAMTIIGERVILRKISRDFVLGRDTIDARLLQAPLRREGTHDGD